MKVNILGTEYKIERRSLEKDKGLEGRFGYCSWGDKLIVEIDLDTLNEWKDEPKENKETQYKQIRRHEIIHAFLYESGLHASSADIEGWAVNEEMVDWIAIQSPKMFRAFKEAGCI